MHNDIMFRGVNRGGGVGLNVKGLLPDVCHGNINDCNVKKYLYKLVDHPLPREVLIDIVHK